MASVDAIGVLSPIHPQPLTNCSTCHH
jgi:hypothetical protein